MIREAFKATRVVGIFRGLNEKELRRAAPAIYTGGIRLMEVTMNSPDALSSISGLRSDYDGRMYIGAGTVTKLSEAKEAVSAGALFLVTPNVNQEVIDYCLEHNILVMPGALTPSEIAKAIQYGSEYVKIFPADAFGPSYIKSIMAPFSNLKAIAVGGIGSENAGEYMKNGAYGVGAGGSFYEAVKEGSEEAVVSCTQKLMASVLKG